MSAPKAPALIQFGVQPSTDSDAVCLEVDPRTGLLRRAGVAGAYVEYLIALGGEWQRVSGSATVLTESKDPHDPDLIRTESLRKTLSMETSTVLTKTARPDPIDPDMVRLDAIRSALSSASSTVTRGQRDPEDPDLVRTADTSSVRF